MPAPPDQPNVLRITLDYALSGGTKASCRFYMTYTGGPPTNTNCNAIAAGVSANWATDLAPLMSNDSLLNQVTVEDLTTASSGVGAYTTPVAGSRSGSPNNLEACVLFNSIIQRRYRGGRPRMYQPFGIDSDLDADGVSWSTGFTAACTAGWVAFNIANVALTGIGCTLVAHVNISQYYKFAASTNPVTMRTRDIPTPRGVAIAPDIIISTAARREMSQQKRRRTSTSY